MRTPKQIQASRANGTRSKGPVTRQGKRNSSRNSIRHGLLAETVVLKEEDKPRFLGLLNDLIAEHQPATSTELMLVETIAVADWRRSRIWGMQKENFDHDVASCDVDTDSPALCAVLALRSSPDSIRSHELLLRYEVAFDRQVSRALLRLQQLQETRASRKKLTGPAEPHQSEATRSRHPVPIHPHESRSDASPNGPEDCRVAESIVPQSVPVNQKDAATAKRTQQPIEKATAASFTTAAKFTPVASPAHATRPAQSSRQSLSANRGQKR